MEKTLYDLDKLEEMLGKTMTPLSDTEKTIYYAAANVLATNLVTRWNELKLTSIFYIEAEMKDLMWHVNVLFGYMRPTISLEDHYMKARTKLINTRRNIESKRVTALERARHF